MESTYDAKRYWDKENALYENLLDIWPEVEGFHPELIEVEHVVRAAHIALEEADEWLDRLAAMRREGVREIPWNEWGDSCDDLYLIPILQWKAEQ